MTTPVRSRLVLTLALLLSAPLAAQSYVNFEGQQTRPIAISQDGSRLYAINTPDNRLAVYSLANPSAPLLMKEIPVGLEPISVRIRSKDEVWVVNEVSDTISVVDVNIGAVTATIQLGDEPADVVFSGNPQRAFVSLSTDRQVRVLDPNTHQVVGNVAIFGDEPRSLVASSDGKTVWVAVARSGNRTTIVPHTIAPAPPKPTNQSLPLAPKQGIIVDAEDQNWKNKLNVKLPDIDVVEIDVATLKVRKTYSAVGTTLFNMAERPGSNELWVANTEALNKVRFEPALKGHSIDSRLTKIVVTGTTVTPIDLNPGINYSQLPNNSALSTALSQPTDVVFHSAGKVGYVTAFGTDRVGVIDDQGKVTARIEVGNTAGTKVDSRNKRGPRGLALHPSQPRLYVLNRISNSITVIDTGNNKAIVELSQFDPTPKVAKEGRGFLYDAKLSGNGTMSCGSCHIDGRHDGLAWDLGDPGGQMINIGSPTKLHPMKGPMVTQTLVGIKGERVLHWRGDRVGFKGFNPAFVGLLGRSAQIPANDMDDFGKFVDTLEFAPNPNRNRDNSLPNKPAGQSAKDGETVFNTKFAAKDGQNTFRCADCHQNASGTGSFGFTGQTGQQMKAVQLRGLHKRMGRKKQAQGRTSGFGIGSEGFRDDIMDWMVSPRFTGFTSNEKIAVERFVLAFQGHYVPTVGFSRTVTSANFNNNAVAQDIALLISQADANKNDLVVKGYLDGRQVGFSYNRSSKKFDRDRKGLSAMTLAQIGNVLGQKGSVLTFLGVPPGSGVRIGIDRDEDSVLDGDEGLLHYGAASPACATVIRIDGNSAPNVGNGRFAVVMGGAPANATGWFLLGLKRATGKVADLNLLVDLNTGLMLPLQADARGGLAVNLPIPNNAALVGAKVNLQTAVNAPCGQLQAAASPGLEVTVLK